jgi:hypothetical protein
MRYLIITLLFIASCGTSADQCEPVQAEYVQFISYQDVQAHRFHGANIYFWYKDFNGEIGKTYKLCVSGNDVIKILD